MSVRHAPVVVYTNVSQIQYPVRHTLMLTSYYYSPPPLPQINFLIGQPVKGRRTGYRMCSTFMLVFFNIIKHGPIMQNGISAWHNFAKITFL